MVVRDYTFDVKGLKAGRQKVLFKKTPIMPGKTLEDVKRAAAEMDERPSELRPIDGRASFTTAVLDGGTEQVVDLKVKKPGR